MKSCQQLEDIGTGLKASKNIDVKWGAIREQEEIEQKPVEEKKPVVKRPFLARGTGKAGGIGNPLNQSVVHPDSQKRE